jgi:hypothetical protein
MGLMGVGYYRDDELQIDEGGKSRDLFQENLFSLVKQAHDFLCLISVFV